MAKKEKVNVKLDYSKEYVVVGTGNDSLIGSNEYTVSGQTAETLISKGFVELK